jgi:methionyl-tRNA formyltransferase
MLNIVFFGSSVHSLKILSALNHFDNSNYRINTIGIVSQPDRPVGRKQEIIPTPVSEYAKKNNIPLYNPQTDSKIPWKLTEPEKLIDFVKKLNPDIIIVAYYGQKIPKDLINLPKFGVLNIHPSLLPNYPGSSPSVYAIMDGQKTTGVSIIKMNENFDEGEIIAFKEEAILDTDTPETLYERLFTIGADLLEKILPDYLSGKIIPQKQGKRTSVYASRLSRNSGKIDWSKPPIYLERFIRAMSPWPGAWTEILINGLPKRLKILKSHLENGKLIIDLVQLEGKNPVTFKQFSQGYHLDTKFFTSNTLTNDKQ